MSENLTVKIHDVLHNSNDYNPSEVAEYIVRHSDDSIKSVRVAKGDSNSPIFIHIDANTLNLRTIKNLAREAVRLFSYQVEGVNIGHTIKDKNIKIQT